MVYNPTEEAKQEFEELCAKIEQIDKQAARWLREQPKGEDEGQVVVTGDLYGAIVFCDIPQGVSFWFNIAEQVEKTK